MWYESHEEKSRRESDRYDSIEIYIDIIYFLRRLYNCIYIISYMLNSANHSNRVDSVASFPKKSSERRGPQKKSWSERVHAVLCRLDKKEKEKNGLESEILRKVLSFQTFVQYQIARILLNQRTYIVKPYSQWIELNVQPKKLEGRSWEELASLWAWYKYRKSWGNHSAYMPQLQECDVELLRSIWRDNMINNPTAVTLYIGYLQNYEKAYLPQNNYKMRYNMMKKKV